MREAFRVIRTSGIGSGGRVTESVAASMRRAMLSAVGVWNAILIPVVLTADPRWPTSLLVLVHLAMVGVAVAARRGRIRLEVVLLLGYCAWTSDYLAARSVNDAISLAACWEGNLLYAGGALSLRTRARTRITVLAPIVVVAVIVGFSPVWTFQVASAFIVTAVAIVVAARFAMPSLWSLAEAADANVDDLANERHGQEVLRRTSHEAAEDARLVHDTVINTLGAVANYGSALGRDPAVRIRCRADLVVVESMLLGRVDRRQSSFADIGDASGRVSTARTGLVGIDLDELADLLGTDIVDALVGASQEAVRNVGKHAGVESCTVDVRRTGAEVVVSVTDRGIGFDPRSAAGHGLTESIQGRIRAAGGDASVESQPGRGTRVTIRCPIRLETTVAEGLDIDVAATTSGLTRRACWLASLALVGIGVVIEAVNRPGELTWTYAMLALVAGCIALSHRSVVRGTSLPVPFAIVLTLAVPAGFVASAAAIDYGRTDVIYYQAIGIAPLLMILLVSCRPVWGLVAASTLSATAITLAVVMWRLSDDYGVIMVVCAAPALGVGAGWWSFQKLVLRIVTESEDARRSAFDASLETTTQSEIAHARRRWGTAGLERAAGLLRSIGAGESDVSDPEVQRACAAEEVYLRQLLLLSPTAYRMSVWFAHALAAARAREVRLVIRSGDQDAPDSVAAGTVGSLVLRAVEDAPPGAEMTVSWFPTSAGPRLSIVRPAVEQAAAPTDFSLPDSWDYARNVYADQELIEVVLA
jgi:hypothetical protein